MSSPCQFLERLRPRQALPIRGLLKEILPGLIFAQHIPIALARFDGTAQRLRFLMGDSGIQPTLSARETLAQLNIPWMSDRLETPTALLCDCGVLVAQDGTFHPGPAASDVKLPI